MKALRTLCVCVAIGCGPPVDASAITLSMAAPAGWRAEDTVIVRGQQWFWDATWVGERELVLLLPVGRPVKLEIRSLDVPHRLQFPALGLDVGSSPDSPAAVWVTMQREGTWRSRCVQECLEGQPEAMTLKLEAQSSERHAEWLASRLRASATLTPAEKGLRLFYELGCASCHKSKGSHDGPPLAKFWGSEQEASDGRKVVVEGEVGEQIVRQSMLAPNDFLLAGWPASMPIYKWLDEAELAAIVTLLRCQATPDQPECAGLSLDHFGWDRTSPGI